MLNLSVLWGRGGMVWVCGCVCTCVHTYIHTPDIGQDGDGDYGFWIITFLNCKVDSLKEDLRVITRQILGLPSKCLEFPGTLVTNGERRRAAALRLVGAQFL